mmetsp:Transcript_37115/g.41481  ORF Transcript_37115/g.41481 Transcript_37115/m.41481 type:complete len:343 (+) Transcript_37115:39-1067(+)
MNRFESEVNEYEENLYSFGWGVGSCSAFLLAAAGLGEGDVDLTDVLTGSHPFLGFVYSLNTLVRTGFSVENNLDGPLGKSLFRALHHVVPPRLSHHFRPRWHEKELFPLPGFQRRLGRCRLVICIRAVLPGIILTHRPNTDKGSFCSEQAPPNVPDTPTDTIIHNIKPIRKGLLELILHIGGGPVVQDNIAPNRSEHGFLRGRSAGTGDFRAVYFGKLDRHVSRSPRGTRHQHGWVLQTSNLPDNFESSHGRQCRNGKGRPVGNRRGDFIKGGCGDGHHFSKGYTVSEKTDGLSDGPVLRVDFGADFHDDPDRLAAEVSGLVGARGLFEGRGVGGGEGSVSS